jgi:hypothetical protein
MISPHSLQSRSWNYISLSGVLILISLLFFICISLKWMTYEKTRPDAIPMFTGIYANGVNLPSTHSFVFDLYERYAYDLIMKTHSKIHSKHIHHDIFEDVHVNYPFSQSIMEGGDGQGRKAMIYPPLMFPTRHKKCIVYGIGIDQSPQFEEKMARYCNVHAFDCTVPLDLAAFKGKPFSFHRQCIGATTGLELTSYGSSGIVLGPSLSLNETMSKLGHRYIDILKFDIEGGEWELIDELLHGAVRPRQIFFELHTFCASPRFVPQSLVSSKDKSAVNALFVKLYHAGYRLMSKDPNLGDPCCCEFSMVYIL